MYLLQRLTAPATRAGLRFASSAHNRSCKLLVLGGGSGGCSVAAKFASRLGKNQVIVVDPADRHYYQPMLTMVGGGIKRLSQASREMGSVLPKEAEWVKEAVVDMDPAHSEVTTSSGLRINYDYLVVALGVKLHYEKIEGAVEALKAAGSGVCSNYSPSYAELTFDTLKKLRSGNAVFTFPNTPIKCGGAPLKVCFLSEHYLRKTGKRGDVKFHFRSAQPVIFTAKYYAEKLHKICEKREIAVGLRQELVKVDHARKEAVFKDLGDKDKLETVKYSMLHITPPMHPPEVLRSDKSLHDASGYLKVDRSTLRHDAYKNVFGLGDCTNLPTSKTAAAVAAQSGVLYDNLVAEMGGRAGRGRYDGYTSCPLVTGFGSCIMAEFDYDLKPLETFPIDQSKEHLSMYIMKKDLMPALYWHAMLKGYWRGPGLIRKVLHLGMGK